MKSRLSTLAKTTLYPGENYALPWRKLRFTLAKTTLYLHFHYKNKAIFCPEDKKKKIEEWATPVDNSGF
jgi:hypothetical protein